MVEEQARHARLERGEVGAVTRDTRLNLGAVLLVVGSSRLDGFCRQFIRLRDAGGMLSDIFTQANSRFNNPVNLKRRHVANVQPTGRRLGKAVG